MPVDFVAIELEMAIEVNATIIIITDPRHIKRMLRRHDLSDRHFIFRQRPSLIGVNDIYGT